MFQWRKLLDSDRGQTEVAHPRGSELVSKVNVPTGMTWVKGQAWAMPLLAVPSVAVNAANNDQETALIRAVACGHEAVVHALLANVSTLGLDVNLTTRSGRSALIIAAASGNTALVAALLAIDGIDTDTTDRDGLTALRHAVAGGHAEAASAIRVHNRRQLQEELRSERAAITQRGRDP